jgi:hypothetical protein
MVDTRARPGIWRDRAGFERAADNDTVGFTKQLDLVNQACAICHASSKAGENQKCQSGLQKESGPNPPDDGIE